MRALAKTTWVELKLFVREPISMVFAFVFPILILVVLAGVFGNTVEDEAFGSIEGIGPTDYYLPAYVGLSIAAVGLVALPVHLASYRELGVLRRFRASSMPVWVVVGAQLLVMLVIATIGSIALMIVAIVFYDTYLPQAPLPALGAFLLSAVTFAAIGVFLGALLPTARAAQSVGLILFFLMMILAGAGPPRFVMTEGMRRIGDVLPLTYAIEMLQYPWHDAGWDLGSSIVVVGFLIGAGVLTLRYFRWR